MFLSRTVIRGCCSLYTEPKRYFVQGVFSTPPVPHLFNCYTLLLFSLPLPVSFSPFGPFGPESLDRFSLGPRFGNDRPPHRGTQDNLEQSSTALVAEFWIQ